MAKIVKRIQKFTNFTNENWRQSKKLSDVNDLTGALEEDDERTVEVENYLKDFEKIADQGFNDVFEKAFVIAEEGLFGGDFNEYIAARKSQGHDKLIEELEEFKIAFENLKTAIVNDLRSVNLDDYYK